MAMMNTLLIAICAISFAGTMSVTGGLDTLISKLVEKSLQPSSLWHQQLLSV